MHTKIDLHLNRELEQTKEAGLFKKERVITSKQGPEIELANDKRF